MIPILFAYDPTRLIGRVTSHDSRLSFEFTDSISQDDFFNIFGNCAVIFTSQELVDGVVRIKAGTILEFSLEPVKPQYEALAAELDTEQAK